MEAQRGYAICPRSHSCQDLNHSCHTDTIPFNPHNKSSSEIGEDPSLVLSGVLPLVLPGARFSQPRPYAFL